MIIFFTRSNNLFLAASVFCRCTLRREPSISEVNDALHPPTERAIKTLSPRESLWFITCMFHDPDLHRREILGYVRGSHTVYRMMTPLRTRISRRPSSRGSGTCGRPHLWEREMTSPACTGRAVKNGFRPLSRRRQPDVFDNAINRAYFDGRNTSHSLVSGLRLINLCQSHDVPEAKQYNPAKLLSIACRNRAALGMMFHDQRYRKCKNGRGHSPDCVRTFAICVTSYVRGFLAGRPT